MVNSWASPKPWGRGVRVSCASPRRRWPSKLGLGRLDGGGGGEFPAQSWPLLEIRAVQTSSSSLQFSPASGGLVELRFLARLALPLGNAAEGSPPKGLSEGGPGRNRGVPAQGGGGMRPGMGVVMTWYRMASSCWYGPCCASWPAWRCRGWRTSRAPGPSFWWRITRALWTPSLSRSCAHVPSTPWPKAPSSPGRSWDGSCRGQMPSPQGVTALNLKQYVWSFGRLAEGHAVGVYPEGERSWDARIQPFRRGTIRLLLKAGVPVIPCGLAGTYDVLPRWSKTIRRTRIRVEFGKAHPMARHARPGGKERRSTCRRRPPETDPGGSEPVGRSWSSLGERVGPYAASGGPGSRLAPKPGRSRVGLEVERGPSGKQGAGMARDPPEVPACLRRHQGLEKNRWFPESDHNFT